MLITLLIALPVYGLSGTLLDLLGSKHQHQHQRTTTVSSAMEGWQDFRRASAKATPRTHSHALWARHHHDRSDSTVVSMDGITQDASAGEGASSSTVPSGMGSGVWQVIGIHQPLGNDVSWPGETVARIVAASVDPLERPPKT